MDARNPEMPPLPPGGARRPMLTRTLSVLVALALIAYAAWWGGWIALGRRLPPSPLTWLTGMPSPTTGCTRSLRALLHGDLARSLEFHPGTVPILVLLAVTLLALGVRLSRRQPLRLPAGFLYAWLVVLALSWAAKFLLGAQYW